MRLFGIRGATSVKENKKEPIIIETQRLLNALIEANNIKREDVVSVIITSTPDLTAEFPAKACRLLGWNEVPLLGAVEADVPHGIPLCIRILIHVYLEEGSRIQPVYLNEAVHLRPDLVFAKQSPD